MRYVTVRNLSYIKISSVNSLFLIIIIIIIKINGYIEESIGSNYLKLVLTNENKDNLKKLQRTMKQNKRSYQIKNK